MADESSSAPAVSVAAAVAAAASLPPLSPVLAALAAVADASVVTRTATSARDGSPSLAGTGRMDEPRTKRQEKESRDSCWLEDRKGTFTPSSRPKALMGMTRRGRLLNRQLRIGHEETGGGEAEGKGESYGGTMEGGRRERERHAHTERERERGNVEKRQGKGTRKK